MELELASIAIAAFALAVSIFTQWQRRRDITRAAMPIVRAAWRTGEAGHSIKLELVNRLDEDLRITRVEAKAPLVTNRIEKDAGGSIIHSEAVIGAPYSSLDWSVPAGESGLQSFRIHGADSPRWLQITVSSSNSTLRRKRLTVSST